MARNLLRAGLADLDLPDLGDPVLERLLWYLDELLRWNRHHNLTAIADRAEGIEKHLLDALTLLPFLSGRERLLDIGSGAGLPGLPLKVACPELALLSIDGVAKKVRFQRHVIRHLGLRGATARACRLEELADEPSWRGHFEVIVFRALGEMRRFVPLALPCLAPEGRFLLMKGPEGDAEMTAAAPGLRAGGVVLGRRRELTLPVTGARRTIFELVRSR